MRMAHNAAMKMAADVRLSAIGYRLFSPQSDKSAAITPLIGLTQAAPRVVSYAEAARVQPEGSAPAAHDARNRRLYRLEPDTMPLWQEAEALVDHIRGRLIIDDSTLDKPQYRKTRPVRSSARPVNGRATGDEGRLRGLSSTLSIRAVRRVLPATGRTRNSTLFPSVLSQGTQFAGAIPTGWTTTPPIPLP